MSPSTPSRSALRAFRRRRAGLILLRGVCATLVTLVTAMAAVVLLDFLFVLPDMVRWALSAAGYAVSLAVAWRTCLRKIVRMPSDRQLARLVEATRPELREDLISAVELGSWQADEDIDSPVFRQLLQESVAGRVDGLRASQLLPWRLVRGWLITLAVLLSVGVLLITAIGSPFSALLERAYFPSANIAHFAGSADDC